MSNFHAKSPASYGLPVYDDATQERFASEQERQSGAHTHAVIVVTQRVPVPSAFNLPPTPNPYIAYHTIHVGTLEEARLNQDLFALREFMFSEEFTEVENAVDMRSLREFDAEVRNVRVVRPPTELRNALDGHDPVVVAASIVITIVVVYIFLH